jgi:hypothetical protein
MKMIYLKHSPLAVVTVLIILSKEILIIGKFNHIKLNGVEKLVLI